MRDMTRARSSLLRIALLGIASAICTVPAAAQSPIEKADTARANPNQVQVALVRQDQSDCTNSNVNTNDPSLVGGTVWVTRKDATTNLEIAVTMKPKTKYNFYLKCVRQIGDVTTDDEGSAVASLSFPTKDAGNVFAFDMYPDGAPAGNKYQSVQVKFQ
jgi:hypothetical protein